MLNESVNKPLSKATMKLATVYQLMTQDGSPHPGQMQLRGVPWSTDYETVVEMLSSIGFTEIELLTNLAEGLLQLGAS